ncbi:bestrophin family protein [Allorhodopirellula heiligendammensis]|uniref:bestrophin family protein n=1 Tax=Allorhodopirellula heiligendammensis TaxID=2714739 RepID=UPI00265F3EF2|nr:bestrophin family ion channel [Allorhodopirellula heiligendammensis]
MKKTDPIPASSKPLSYSYWLGTFVLQGTVAPRVMLDVVGFGLLATGIVYLSEFAMIRFDVSLAVPGGPFEVAGAVLGLLLVLRLNAGYDRWWEARKLWGGIVNESRNLAIAGLAYGPPDHHWRVQFIKWIASFPHVTRRSLRGERQVPELSRLLTEQQIEALLTNSHLPDAVSRQIASLLAEGRGSGMDALAFYSAEKQRCLLIDYLGGCERILKTPLARSSAIQVRQFIFILLASLPFSLLDDFHGTLPAIFGTEVGRSVWLIPLFIMVIAFMLLSLDRIGMELQNPFDTRRVDFLPLDNICITIEQNLLELLHDDALHDYAAPTAADVELPPDASTHATDDNIGADIS